LAKIAHKNLLRNEEKVHTFRTRRQRNELLLSGLVYAGVAGAFGMDLLGLAELATLCALGDGAALFLDFEEGTVCVMAGGRSVPLYARLAGWGLAAGPSAGGGAGGVPGKLFVIDIDLGDRRSD
jgi:hypothetical protein